MRIRNRECCEPEPVLYSLEFFGVGDVFGYPKGSPNSSGINCDPGPYMRIWADYGQWRYISLSSGQTWSGNKKFTMYTTARFVPVDAEVCVR